MQELRTVERMASTASWQFMQQPPRTNGTHIEHIHNEPIGINELLMTMAPIDKLNSAVVFDLVRQIAMRRVASGITFMLP